MCSFSGAKEIESMTIKDGTLERYTICVMITYGSAHDLALVPSIIKDCESLPLSIIMIHVGHPDNFGDLHAVSSAESPVQGVASREVLRVIDYK